MLHRNRYTITGAMENVLTVPAPHPHNHDHGHHHDHAHTHDHTHHHHEAPARVAGDGGFSLIALSSLARLALVVPPIAVLWLLALWAMNHG